MNRLFPVVLTVAYLFSGCHVNEDKILSSADSVRVRLLKYADSLDHIIEVKPVTYSAVVWKGKSIYNEFVNVYGDSIASLILSLNRVDINNIKKNDTLIVPDTLSKNMLLYSPFPLAFNRVSAIPKILFISQSIQAFAAYEFGVLVRWGPTSTGKRTTPTPNGLFHTNWKAKETISTIDEEWLLKWSFNIDNFDGISIHQYAMPGYPTSHSCARLLEADAMWLYYWAKQWIVTRDEEDVIAYGTPVIIFGAYQYGGRRPWRRLPEDPNALRIAENELDSIVFPSFITIIRRQLVRDSVLAQRDSIRNAAKPLNM